VAFNKIVDRYFCICQRCGVRRFQERFPRSRTDPGLPGLYCRPCQRKIDKEREQFEATGGYTDAEIQALRELYDPFYEPEPKPKKRPKTRPTSTTALAKRFDTVVCQAVNVAARYADGTLTSREMFPWVVYAWHGTERYYAGAGNNRNAAIRNAREGNYSFPCPERPGDELGTELKFILQVPSLNGEKVRWKVPWGLCVAIIRMREPGYARPRYWEPSKIPPSKYDGTKDRTRFEDDGMGGVDLYAHDKLVGTGETWRGAVKDALGKTSTGDGQISLMNDLFPDSAEAGRPARVPKKIDVVARLKEAVAVMEEETDYE
jgi:hypothetical protein